MRLGHVTFLLLLALPPVLNAFTFVGKPTPYHLSPSSFGTALFAQPFGTVEEAKSNLIQVAERLQKQDGKFVMAPQAKNELQEAVVQLEETGDAPTQSDYEDYFSGDWTLVCTTATTEAASSLPSLPQLGNNKLFPNLPFLENGPLAKIKESLQNRLVVLQRIRSKDRIDHVLQYTPPDTVQDLFPDESSDIPEPLLSINLNPLQVKESKVTLIHKAEVQSITPVLRTKLGLQSIVLNIAGESQVLDPSGADVLGINLPLGEFLNSGSFDTTYMDSDLRISRGKVGFVDQLRVFRKTATATHDDESVTAVADEEETTEIEDVEEPVVSEQVNEEQDVEIDGAEEAIVDEIDGAGEAIVDEQQETIVKEDEPVVEAVFDEEEPEEEVVLSAQEEAAEDDTEVEAARQDEPIVDTVEDQEKEEEETVEEVEPEEASVVEDDIETDDTSKSEDVTDEEDNIVDAVEDQEIEEEETVEEAETEEASLVEDDSETEDTSSSEDETDEEEDSNDETDSSTAVEDEE